MGTWGAGIFSDDDACDIRAEFRDLVGQGLPPEEATEIIIADFPLDPDEPARAAVFWMALAAAQWKCGRLTDEVKKRALAVIDAGGDLSVWQAEAPEHVRKRQTAIQRLRSQLLGEQPPPTRIRNCYINTTDWEPGDAISYRLLSGRLAIWRVLGIYRKGLATYAVMDICDCVGAEVPDDHSIETAPRRRTKDYQVHLELAQEWGYEEHERRTNGQLLIQASRAKECPRERINRVARGLNVASADEDGTMFFWWSELDDRLAAVFGLT